MIITGYILTAINYALFCLSRTLKKKYQMLTCDLLSKIALVAALFCLGSLSGAYSFGCTFCWLIFANIKERKNQRWMVGYSIFEILLIAILIFRFSGISSVIIFASASISLFATWWLPPQKMRITGLICSGLTLAYQLSIHNWVGFLEVFVILSNLISYTHYKKTRTEEDSTPSHTA